MRNTKIVATLGPASGKAEVIKGLIKAGMGTARINFSHGDYESHSVIINELIAAREELNAPVALMLDTKGPEIRIRDFADGEIYLEQGKSFTLTTRQVEGTVDIVSISYANLPKDVSVGSRILIDDGLIELKVNNLTEMDIECTTVNSGFLGSRKGINVPDVYVNLPSMTEKDIEDIKFGIKMGFDYIAASFIRSSKDVLEIRQILEENGAPFIHIIAKIESRDGVKNIESILEVADGIMVARGDLGVEIPPEEVPLVQKMLIKKANLMGKPVITATQMLESMVNNPRPTRAEANDVANAIFDGSDAIMLSGETAKGKYPVESVEMMARIALRAEQDINYAGLLAAKGFRNNTSTTNAISYATCTTAADLKASCIVTVTNSGFTARMVSKYKPPCPVVAVALNKMVWRQLSLVWGCYSVYYDSPVMDSDVFKVACNHAVETGFAKNGDIIVITAGVPIGVAGSTNLIKAQIVGDILAMGKGRGESSELVVGRTAVVKNVEDAEKIFRAGDILVTASTDDRMMKYIRKASALVVGSDRVIDTSHAETACDALQIPIIICNALVTDIIPNDISVTIDCKEGFVYNGEIDKK